MYDLSKSIASDCSMSLLMLNEIFISVSSVFCSDGNEAEKRRDGQRCIGAR